MFLYVSNSDFVGGEDECAADDAVSVVELDVQSGAMRLVQTVPGMRSPTYMARNPVHPVLYVLERFIKADKSTPSDAQMAKDGVAAFAISPQDGTLSLAGRASTGGESPMHVSLAGDGRRAFFANPGRPKDPDPKEGHVTVLDLGADGCRLALVGSATYKGPAPTWRHRPKTYPHSVFPDPFGRRLFVPQLMTDLVTIYDLDPPSGALTPGFQPYVQVSSGAGPRHVAFHPQGEVFYVVNSFDATLSVFSYEAGRGLCEIVETVSVHPKGFMGKKNISHALVSRDGRFLYCSHRTHNSIAVFAIGPGSGALTLVGHMASGGERPRDFAFHPDGNLLVLTNQKSNELRSFFVDKESGRLTSTGETLALYSPNCIVFGA